MPEPVFLVHRAQAWSAAKRPMPARYGVELDVRWSGSNLVLDHDLYAGVRTLTYEPIYLDVWLESHDTLPVYAWHIREDGVEQRLSQIVMEEFPEVGARSFVFGGSYPTMRHARELGLRCADRVSDEEILSRTTYCADGRRLWLDRWNWDEPIGYAVNGIVEGDIGGARCVWCPGQHEVWAVSPELHVGHSPLAWLKYHWWLFFRLKVTGICTDRPAECEQAYTQWVKETTLSVDPA